MMQMSGWSRGSEVDSLSFDACLRTGDLPRSPIIWNSWGTIPHVYLTPAARILPEGEGVNNTGGLAPFEVIYLN